MLLGLINYYFPRQITDSIFAHRRDELLNSGLRIPFPEYVHYQLLEDE